MNPNRIGRLRATRPAVSRTVLAGWLAVLTVSAPAPGEEMSALDLARQLNQAFVQVAEQVSPSVVVIDVARRPDAAGSDDLNNPIWDFFPPELKRQLEEEYRKRHPAPDADEPSARPRAPVFDGHGSGVVVRKDGYIVTNRHVVDGADRIRVRFRDGRVFDAVVRGEDYQSDLAVLKIEADDLKPMRPGDSSKTRVGEFAIAIGAPFELDYSVTFGHVSAKGRSRIIGDLTMDQDFIQTDADINPGNSGGPLVNIEGEVIGINTLIRGLSTGIGFAIPINLVMEVADKLIDEGKYVRAWLGVGITSLRDYEDYRRLVVGVQDGVVVTEIKGNGPARRSTLRTGDIITAVDGVAVATGVELKAAIRSKSIGSSVALSVHRLERGDDKAFQGRDLEVAVRLEAWPETWLPLATAPERAEPKNLASALGLTVEVFTSDLAESYGIEKIAGVVVTRVEEGSPAASRGIEAGDVITEVDRNPVTTPKELAEALAAGDFERGVILNFSSRGTSRFEVLTLPREQLKR